MLISLLAPLVFAAAPSGHIVLVERGPEIPKVWEESLRSTSQKIVKDKDKLVDAPTAGLEDLSLLFACGQVDAACVGKILSTTKAKYAVYVKVLKRGEGAWLSYSVVNRVGTVEREAGNYDITRDDSGLAVASEILTHVFDKVGPTHLFVSAEEVDVYVDGAFMGKGPLSVVAEVKPGPHIIEVRREGFATLKQEQNVLKGRTTRKGFSMRKEPSAGNSVGNVEIDPDEDKKAERMKEPFTLRSLAWPVTIAGALLTATSGGVLFFTQTMYPCAIGTDSTQKVYFLGSCKEPAGTAAEVDAAEKKLEQFQTASTFSAIVLPIGVVTLVGGLALFLIDPAAPTTNEITQGPLPAVPTFVWLEETSAAPAH